ncbi:ribonuclease P protein subunit p30-like [Ptychodera flava]|uniref:ribonuclease P protein subunit p30-like n=1 Tax=Ptychodera flava TaxID=63121 RepID=UPI00396A98FF
MARFHDLKLSAKGTSLKKSVKTLIELGYEVVALNQTVTSLDKKTQIQKPPPPIELDDAVLSPLKVKAKNFRQLSRLTIVLKDTQTYRLSSGPVQSFDIVAIQPESEKVFQLACTQLEIDIITLNLAERLPFRVKFHPVKAAIERGIHFEINYAPAVRDSTARRNIISNALSLMSMCKGKNIILSSDAESAMELRGPYDVANLGFLFGMKESQAKDAVSMNCRSVLLHADTRRNTAKAAVSVTHTADLSERDKWKVRENQRANPLSTETDNTRKDDGDDDADSDKDSDEEEADATEDEDDDDEDDDDNNKDSDDDDDDDNNKDSDDDDDDYDLHKKHKRRKLKK